MPALLLIGIFLLALLIRVLYIKQILPTPIFFGLATDAGKYDLFALQILKGNLIYKDSIYLNPLYPFFLASIYFIVGQSHLSVVLIQAAIDSLSCLLIYYIASTLFNKGVGTLAAFLYACYGIAIFYTGILLATTAVTFLTLVFITALLFAEERGKLLPLFIAGIFLGCAILGRPNMALFLVFLPLWFFSTFRNKQGLQKSIRGFLLLLLGLSTIMVFIGIRNYFIEKEFTLSFVGGINFYIGNNPKATGTFMLLDGISNSPIEQLQESIHVAEKELGKALTTSEASRHWLFKGLGFIKDNPLDALLLYLKKLALFWGKEEISQNINYNLSKSLAPIFQAPFISFGILAPFAILGILLSLKRKITILPLLFIFSYMVSVIIFFVSARYRLLVVPFLIIYASYSLYWFVETKRARKVKPLLFGSTLLIVLFMVINRPFAHSTPPRTSYHYNNLGVAYTTMEKWDEAILEFNKALSVDSQNVKAYYNLGNVYYKKGLHQEAIDAYQQALMLQPNFAEAHNNLGLVYDIEGKFYEAAQEYQRALKIKPSHLPAHINLGNIYRNQGSYKEAINHYKRALEIEPESAGVLNNLGIVYGIQGRVHQAISAFNTALALEPENAKTYYNRGTAYGKLGKFDEGIADLKRALTINPLNAETHYKLGLLLYKKGLRKEARAAFKKAATLNPAYSNAYKQFGLSTLKPGNDNVP